MINGDETFVGSFGKRLSEFAKNGFKKDLPVPNPREVLLVLILLSVIIRVFFFKSGSCNFGFFFLNLTGAN